MDTVNSNKGKTLKDKKLYFISECTFETLSA